MTKKIIFNVLIFALGAGTGYLIAKKTLEEGYARIVEEEIDAIREHYLNKKQAEDGQIETRSTPYSDKDAFRTAPNPLIRTSLDMDPYEQAKRAYNINGRPNPEPDEDDGEVRDAAGMSEADTKDPGVDERDLAGIDRTRPYTISYDEYANEFPQHEKVNLYYYIYDQAIADSQDELLEDPSGVLGDDALELLADGLSCYVRNEPIAVDYEVNLVRASYEEIIMNSHVRRNLSPRENYERNKGREGRYEK
jgi:hypothetical protein